MLAATGHMELTPDIDYDSVKHKGSLIVILLSFLSMHLPEFIMIRSVTRVSSK